VASLPAAPSYVSVIACGSRYVKDYLLRSVLPLVLQRDKPCHERCS
jgi:hypothetical protein